MLKAALSEVRAANAELERKLSDVEREASDARVQREKSDAVAKQLQKKLEQVRHSAHVTSL